ncbi:MAG TPA: sigma-54 dependent transcriptional regulator, partial [Candidatus Angelobacter sp.]|nr:sigma-54 dependent transcriptional regulator [Candidatus Angelobacter sp.]
LSIIRTQVDLYRTMRRAERLEAENSLLRAQNRPVFIAESKTMEPLLTLMSRIGPSDANVLITGEHGTGKEVVAQTLHALSSRGGRPMITVNTGGLPEGTFESELFGHVKGAFTDARADRVGRFELADRGTLFLDEIANVPIKQQAKLLRVLETGDMERVGSSKTHKVDVRVISATNADLKVESAEGRFRSDLLFRLNTVELHIPPLRERKEDIPLLAAHFLKAYAQRYRKPVKSFDAPALEKMLGHPWPGNVRELDHATERAVLMSTGEEIHANDLGLEADKAAPGKIEDMSLEEVESLLIRKALARHSGNISHAADALGLSRSALYRRMQKYGF